MSVRITACEVWFDGSRRCLRVLTFIGYGPRHLRRLLLLVCRLWPVACSVCHVRGVVDGAESAFQFDLIRGGGFRLVVGCPDSLVDLLNELGLCACSERLGV